MGTVLAVPTAESHPQTPAVSAASEGSDPVSDQAVVITSPAVPDTPTAPAPTAVVRTADGSTALAAPRPFALWRVVTMTVATCFRYRVTALAAEVGFFALLSLPPLVLGLFGTVGYLSPLVDEQVLRQSQNEIIRLAGLALSDQSVRDVITPTLHDVIYAPRPDIMSLGFLLSLWSGSRAVNVYIDTVSIMYGLGGHRGIIHQRVLSFGFYLVGLVLGIVLAPLVLAGPTLVNLAIPEQIGWVNALYWPVVLVLLLFFLALLYHLSIPVRTRWWRALPGAILAMSLVLGLSYVLRLLISVSVGGESIYGPLSSPIVVLLWLYMLAIAALIGAALNASVDRIWPGSRTQTARRLNIARLRAQEQHDDQTRLEHP